MKKYMLCGFLGILAVLTIIVAGCGDSVCGDEICQSDETCSSCASDCGSCPVIPPAPKYSNGTWACNNGFNISLKGNETNRWICQNETVWTMNATVNCTSRGGLLDLNVSMLC